MDIAGMSMAMSQAKVQQQASISVMKSAMSTVEQDGDVLIEMLNNSETSQAKHPNLGTQFDVKV